MSQAKICPSCRFENSTSAELCKQCGSVLPERVPSHLITEKVVKIRPDATKVMPVVEHLPSLLPQTLVVFVAGEEEPIVLKEVTEVVLGRALDGPMERTLDLTDHEAMALGVSRRHALVEYRDESFMLRDLGSTNGSQLNDEPLLPSRAYRLRPFDQITLGRLKLMVYFQSEGVEETQSIMLEDVNLTQAPQLTPQYLADVLLPYLYALSELQRVYRECLEQPQASFQVRQIQAARADAFTRMQLVGADDVIGLVRKWIVPWQKINSVATMREEKLVQKMKTLVMNMFEELLPEATAVCQERLLSPVLAIVTSGLILTVEVAVN